MAYIPNSFSTRESASSAGAYGVPALGTAGSDLLRINEVDPMFTNLNDGSALLYRMLNMYRKDAPSSQPQYWFFEDDQYAVKSTAASEAAADATTVVLTDAIAVAGSVIFVPSTNDARLVTGASGATLTVVCNHQGRTSAVIPAGAEIVLLGATLSDGGDANGGIAQLPTKVDNMISFFSQSVSATDLQEVTNMLNGVGQINGEFAKQTLHVMRQADLALRLSKGGIGEKGGKVAYYTKGLNEYLTTDAELPKAGMTWYDLNALFNDAFLPTNSSPSKTLIVSQKAYSLINKVCFERWTANPAFESTLGATMGQIALDGGGIVDVVCHKHWGMDAGKQGYLLDMPFVSVKPMAGFEMNWRDITLPSAHSKTYEVFGSTSMCVKLPALHRTISIQA